MRCEMLAIDRRSSLKRLGPSPSITTTRTLHLSPTRSSTSLTARQSSGTCRLLGNTAVRSCVRFLGIYLAPHSLVAIRPAKLPQPPVELPPHLARRLSVIGVGCAILIAMFLQELLEEDH